MLSSLFVILLNYHDDCCVLWLYYWYDVINANKMIHNELVLLVCFSTVDDMNLLIWSNPIHYKKIQYLNFTGIPVLYKILKKNHNTGKIKLYQYCAQY
jgi:hypothetical protein